MLLASLFFLIPLAVWAVLIEPRSFQINRYKISLSKPLSRKLRVLHLSDMHIAGDHPHLSRFFDQLSKLFFDLVFVSGDIIDHARGIPFAADYLGRVSSRFGTFAVFGNHDYFNYEFKDTFKFMYHAQPKKKNPIEQLEKALGEKGIRVLRNESCEIHSDGEILWIHGLDDPTTGRGDFEKIKSKIAPEKINLLLTHTVDAFYYLNEGDVDLSVSGHSHGGQVRLPWIGPVVHHTRLGKAYADGIKILKGAVCSISRGLHSNRYLWPRFLCRPEAIILELEGCQSGGGTPAYVRIDALEDVKLGLNEKFRGKF